MTCDGCGTPADELTQAPHVPGIVDDKTEQYRARMLCDTCIGVGPAAGSAPMAGAHVRFKNGVHHTVGNLQLDVSGLEGVILDFGDDRIAVYMDAPVEALAPYRNELQWDAEDPGENHPAAFAGQVDVIGGLEAPTARPDPTEGCHQ